MGIFIDTDRPYPDGADRHVARIHTDENKPRYKEARTRTEVELFVVRYGGARNYHLRAAMTLTTALAWFFENLPEDLDPQTIVRYKRDLRLSLLKVVPGETMASAITADDYRRVLTYCLAKPWTTNTIYQRFVVIRLFAVDSVCSGFTTIEPVSDILGGIYPTAPQRLAVIPTKRHIKLIRSACGPRTRLVISLMSSVGMEPTELDRALRKDFCFLTNTIFIRHHTAGHVGIGVPGRTETMDAETRNDLLRWLATSPGGPDDPLFSGNNLSEFGLWLARAQRQVGLVRPKPNSRALPPYYMPIYFNYYAAQTRASSGIDLLTLTHRFGFHDSKAMHRRAGFIVEAKAHAKQDRALVRAAAGQK